MIIKLHQKPIAKYHPAILLSYAKWIILALIAFVILCYFFVDIPLTVYLSNNLTFLKPVASFFSAIFSPFTLLVATPILFFLNHFLWKKEILKELFRVLIFAIPLSFFAVKILKHIFHRTRPAKLLAFGDYGFHLFGHSSSGTSFPSSHACMIGAVFGALSCIYPKYTVQFMLAALIISFSRVIELEHFLSDVACGCIVGALIAQLLYVFMKKRKFTL